MKSGHWFCEHCDDVVFMTYQKAVIGVKYPCPDCGRIACVFVPAQLTRAMIGADWFATMRAVVDAANTPSFPMRDGNRFDTITKNKT